MSDNELIAEFMGFEYHPYTKEEKANGLSQWGWIRKGAKRGEALFKLHGSFLARTTKDLKYDTSWDWLMPVVDKIELLGYYPLSQMLRSEKPARHFFNITDRDHTSIGEANEATKITAHYKAVVEFIKLYNINKT